MPALGTPDLHLGHGYGEVNYLFNNVLKEEYVRQNVVTSNNEFSPKP